MTVAFEHATIRAMERKVGLRERKRRAAMRRIQEVALDLFDAHGFANVTIEQVAEAADVSPSSVYRYFGTKEQLILHDEFDLNFLDVVQGELAAHPPVDAVRRAIATIMAEFFGRDEALARRKTRYWFQEPALQAAGAEQTDLFVQFVAGALAQATGRDAADLDVQVIATTLVWSLVAAARHWHAGGYATPLETELRRALAVVERGLELDAPPDVAQGA
jgi:AcrR family transcriptional regulator